MEQDPLINFLSNLSQKINVEKEHKAIMEGLEAPETVVPLAVTLANLQEKIAKQVQAHLPQEEIDNTPAEVIQVQTTNVEERIETVVEETEESIEEKDNFEDFVSRLKDILANPKEAVDSEVKPSVVEEEKEPELPAEEIEAPIEVSTPKNEYVQELEKQSKPPAAKKSTEDYTSELDKISSRIANESEPAKIADIKKLLEEYAEKYLKKAAIMAEYAGGGGSNAVQYANGGTMNGDLNVIGNYLSGGVNLLNVLSGGGSGNPDVNSVVISSSANWNSTYTTVETNSASWGTGGVPQNLVFDPVTANLSLTLGNTVSLSSLSATGNPAINSIVISNSSYWNNSYTTLTANSAFWQNTYSTVSSNSANWSNAYSNLVSNSAAYLSGYDLSFLSVSSNWNTAYTLATGLTSLSSNWQSTFTTLCSNSSNWNATYTTVQNASGNWGADFTAYTNLTANSANWQSTYTTLCSNSANWVTYSSLNTGSFVNYTDIDTVTGNWNNAYTLATGLTSLSSNWQSVYTTVCSYSAGWGTGGSANLGQIPVLSANWNSSYSTLTANSATWITYSNLNTGSFVQYTDIDTVTGNWNTAYTLATGLTSLSSNWQSVYTTVCSYSAGWGSGSNVSLGQIPILSANWNSSYSTLTANSATWVTYANLNTGSFVKYTDIDTVTGNWNISYTLATGLTSLSSNWQTAYTTLCSNSGTWVTYSNLNTGSFVKYTDIDTVTGNWNTAYTLATGLTGLSSNWQSTYTTLCTNSANWSATTTVVNNNSAAWAVEGLMPVGITTNSTVGGLTQGTIFAANTPLSAILQRMIVAAISATYTYPTLSASTSAFAFEVGTSISPIISSVWTQNDAGSATSYTILSSYSYSSGYAPVTSFAGFTSTYNISSLSSVTLTPFYLLSTTYFETSATYAQGPQKQDNYGNNSGTPISAYFIVSSAFGLSAYRKGFYSADTYTWSLSDSNAVRSLTGTAIVPAGFSVNVPIGTTRLVFAYPSNYALTITNPSSVNISPANGYNVNTTLFTTSGVQVYGANNFALTGYRVFTYVGTPTTGNYTITISQPASSVTYTSPSLGNNITTTTPLCGEIGTLSAINFTSTFTNNDAGGITTYSVLTSWDNTTYTQITAVNTSQTSFTVTTPSVPLSSNGVNPNNTFYIQSSATYSTGPVKYNTYNDLNATGQIQAGGFKTTTSVAISAFRRMYYSFDTSTSTPSDSNSVRALTGVINNPQAGNTYTFTQSQIPAGLKRMVFAYPSYAGPITYAQDTTDNFSYLSNLTLTVVSVSGANGQYPINYNVYTYIAGGTFGNFNFTLTI